MASRFGLRVGYRYGGLGGGGAVAAGLVGGAIFGAAATATYRYGYGYPGYSYGYGYPAQRYVYPRRIYSVRRVYARPSAYGRRYGRF